MTIKFLCARIKSRNGCWWSVSILITLKFPSRPFLRSVVRHYLSTELGETFTVPWISPFFYSLLLKNISATRGKIYNEILIQRVLNNMPNLACNRSELLLLVVVFPCSGQTKLLVISTATLCDPVASQNNQGRKPCHQTFHIAEHKHRHSLLPEGNGVKSEWVIYAKYTTF